MHSIIVTMQNFEGVYKHCAFLQIFNAQQEAQVFSGDFLLSGRYIVSSYRKVYKLWSKSIYKFIVITDCALFRGGSNAQDTEGDTMPEMVKKCPECGSINLFWNREKGEIICRDCGLVIEDKMVDFGQDWREGEDSHERKGRAGAPMTYTQFDQGLGTEIGSSSDLYGLEGKDKSKFFRLRKWQYRISTAIERNLKLALAELRRVASFLKLPKSVEEEAARIYTLAVQRGLVRGRSMESVVAGALYAACRRHEVPRTLDELSEASGIEKKEIGRTYRFVTRELQITVMPSNPSDYIARFASSLKLSPETQSNAVDILNRAQKAELTSGRGPTGIAAAALYVAALIHGEKRTQREVADVAGVTEVTIRNRYKELLDQLDLEKEIKKAKKKQK